jgi:hypothetical protein
MIVVRKVGDSSGDIMKVMPRSEWEKDSFGGVHLSVLFDRECFCPDETYFYVICGLPGEHNAKGGQIAEQRFQPDVLSKAMVSETSSADEMRSLRADIEAMTAAIRDPLVRAAQVQNNAKTMAWMERFNTVVELKVGLHTPNPVDP